MTNTLPDALAKELEAAAKEISTREGEPHSYYENWFFKQGGLWMYHRARAEAFGEALDIMNCAESFESCLSKLEKLENQDNN